MISENARLVKRFNGVLFNPSRTRCGYDNEKVGTGTPTLSTMPGTAASLADNASSTGLARYSELIEAAGAARCTSCKEDCPGCYAKALKAYTGVFEKYLLNTIELHLAPARFYALVEKELYPNPWTCPPVVRLHEGGEFVSAEDLAAFLEFAARHPRTLFFGYSKDERVHFMMLHKLLPSNVRFACSPWTTAEGKVLCPPIGNAYQFIYDDGTSRGRDGVFRCPCSNPDGSINKSATCTGCGRCIVCKDGAQTIVYPHKPAGGLANSWLGGRVRCILKETGAGRSLADYRKAAEAAYQEALTPARGAAFWRKHAAAWLQTAAAELYSIPKKNGQPGPGRIEKLAQAVRAADREAEKAAATPAAAD